MELKYAEAGHFIDQILSERVFSAYQSPARLQLLALREMVSESELVDKTRDFQSPVDSAELWVALMKAIHQCETPEGAREAKERIRTTIKTQGVNRQAQALADAVVEAMKRQQELIQNLQVQQPKTVTDANTKAIDLNRISDPAIREQLRAQDATIQELKKVHSTIDQFMQSFRLLQ